MDLTAQKIAEAVGGELMAGNPMARAIGGSNDSRKILPGELFFPLKGPHFDGHDFIRDALAKGAAGALVQRGEWTSTPPLDAPDQFLIAVENVFQALGDLAHFWRKQQKAKIIAITGSNGKTTTKEMTARILMETFTVLKTEGNLNNLIGLPLMLLRLSPEHEVVVLEMGMSVPGEVRRLREIAEPEVSLITNIGHAHLEFLGDLEGVARAKGELWERLRPDDWIAINVDDPRVVELAAPACCGKKTFGLLKEAEVRGEGLHLDPEVGIRFSLKMGGRKRSVGLATYGRHNVYNALAAATVAAILGMDLEEIAQGLEGFHPFPGRGQILQLRRNVRVLDDSYNANPDSLGATLTAFAEMKGKNRGLVVLGDMLELGPGSPQIHEEAGRRLGAMKLGPLFFLGEQAKFCAQGVKAAGAGEPQIHLAQDPEQVLRALGKVIQEGDWILIKGSRRMRMERIVEGLKKQLGGI